MALGALRTANILALNSGSSSFKFGLYRVDASRVEALLSETVDGVGPEAAMSRVATALAQHGGAAPDAVGHRVVHGGPALRQPVVIDDTVQRQLEAAAIYAPLHMPAALALIHCAQRRYPGLPQVACFDTGFHAGLPDVARVLPIARELRSAGIQRYGFHGLSLESIVRQLGDDLPPRVVIAHLGNGASVTAVKDGRSIDTSMGLTPAGGLIMGTRSGDLDPGVLIHLMRDKQLDADGLEALLNHRSGLLGISGISSDMRRLHEAAPSNPDARLAIDMFCNAVRKQIVAMIAVLDGIDLLVFTGGIGENDAAVRASICSGLSWIGVSLDEAQNRSSSNPISDGSSRAKVLALSSQEDEQIARHARALIAGAW